MCSIEDDKCHKIPWNVRKGSPKGFAKVNIKSISPFKKCSTDFPDGFRNPPDKLRIGGMPFSINAIVTEHNKMLFRDMDNQFLINSKALSVAVTFL